MNLTRILLTAVLALTPMAAQASTAGNGYITSYTPQIGGKLFFSMDGSRSAQPGCSTSNRWVVDGSTAGGQVLVAGLLTAFAQHKQIYVSGSGACNVWGDTEDLTYFTVS